MLDFKKFTFIQYFNKLSTYRKLYIFGMLVLALGLPLSAILTSISQFILFGTWLIEGNFKQKFQQIKNNKIVQAFLLLPLIHIIWLLNTSEFTYALHDLKIKIPLLLFPLILGTIKPLNKTELRYILNTFVAGVFLGSMVSVSVYTGIYHVEFSDVRSISLFISHIRFGLMVIMSLLIMAYYIKNNWLNWNHTQKTLNTLLSIWLISFSILLQSVTSWVVATILIIVFAFRYLASSKKRIVKASIITVLTLFFAFCIGLIYSVYNNFYHTETYNIKNLPTYTKQGNKYAHKKNPVLKENGHYIYILICNKELEETWPKVSSVPFNQRDNNNFTLKGKLIRYLASKGLPKDAEGILALDSEDIKMIENGYASCVYRYKFIPYIKVYDIIWEIDRYIKLGDANDKSLAQRIEFLRTGIHIIKQNFWFGVGTGDVRLAFDKAYIQLDSTLKEHNRLRTHNQLVTFFITFGLVGFIACLYSLLYPGIKHNKYTKTLLIGFLVIVITSMLNEDTLETQTGVTFYIAFYSLLVFTQEKKQ